MKAANRISKRNVMNRAWTIFRGGHYSTSFGDCLKRAWQVEKENAAIRAQEAEEAAYARNHNRGNSPVRFEFDPAIMRAYYSRSGAYVGD